MSSTRLASYSLTFSLAVFYVPLAAAQSAAPQCSAAELAPAKGQLEVRSLAQGLENPWGLVFLPDGRMLVSERPGRLRVVDKQGKLGAPLAGLPEVYASGQGGLLDVALDPAFAKNQLVYFSYAEKGREGAGTAVARAKLDVAANALRDVRVIYRQTPKLSGSGHFGARLVFGRDGSLFIGLGERQKFEPAQDPMQSLGKVVRIHSDGSVPADNPFVGKTGVLPEIWSLGHRNPQGATLNPATGDLWTVEHGARGGDEINIPQPGRNYGWPVISYGVNYSFTKIGEGTAKAGMEQPVCYWDPSIAPGNMVFYSADKIPAWQGNLLVAALKDQSLMRLAVEGNKVVAQERIHIGKRVRDVRVGPDGAVYLLTDESRGEILRLFPKP